MSDTSPADPSAALRLFVLEGDGIGPEIMAATLRVLEAAAAAFGLRLDLECGDMGLAALERCGTTVPPGTLDKARAADGIILGPVSHNDYPPVEQGGLNPSGVFRRELDLFANVRPARTRPGLPSATDKDFDLVIVRENTEGFYADRTMFLGPGEIMPTPDLALAIRKVTARGCRRIADYAFNLARTRRGKVTAVHKANVLRVSDGLFLEQARAVAKANPEVAYEERIIDAMAALLVRDPAQFDVIVTTNMFGDILSDEASEIAGGLGLAASINAGFDHAMAQAQHGSAPDIAGRDIANPTSLIGSVAMLLRWIATRRDDKRLHTAAGAIDAAVDSALARAATRTPDLGGSLGTAAFGEAVAARVADQVASV